MSRRIDHHAISSTNNLLVNNSLKLIIIVSLLEKMWILVAFIMET